MPEYTIEQVKTLDGRELNFAVERLIFAGDVSIAARWGLREFATDWNLLPLAIEKGGPCCGACIMQPPGEWCVSCDRGDVFASGPTLPVAVWRAACVAAIMKGGE